MPFPLAAIAGMAAGGGGGGGGASAALTGLATAAQAVTGQFNAVAGVVGQFVGAIDPAIMQQFGQAMRDLQATIGIALQPVMYALVDTVRETISSLMPLVTQLAPIVEQVASAIGAVLRPVIEALATVFQALMPVVKVVADVMVGVAGLVADLARALRPAIEVVASLVGQFLKFLGVGDNVNGFFEGLRNSLQQLIKTVILAVATFLKMIGANETLAALLRGVAPAAKGPDRGIATLQNAQFKSVADLGRDAALAAFQASAFGKAEQPKKTEDFLAEIQKQVADIAAGRGSDLGQNVKKMVDVMMKVHSGIVDAVSLLTGLLEKAPTKQEVLDGAQDAKAGLRPGAVGGVVNPEFLADPDRRRGFGAGIMGGFRGGR